MAIDFPNSPSVNDLYVAGDITRKWDGTTWSIVPTTITGVTGAVGPDIFSATSPIAWDSTSRVISLNTVPITSGGTGQTTANAALNAFLPTQTSNSGKFLTTDGSNTSWGSAAVSVSNDTTTATALYPLFTSSTTGTITSASVTSSKLTYVPSTGLLSTTGLTVTNTITGSISGNAGTVTNGLYTTSTSSALTSFGTSPVLVTPKIDVINTNTGAATAAALWGDITTGSVTIANALTGNLTLAGATGFAGTVAIANASTSAHGINISNGAGITNKTINIGTGSTAGTTAITLGSSSGATSTITLNGAVSTSGNLTVGGNLTINGTVTTINSTTLTVDDINIVLGDVTTPTDTTANGGGITLLGATNKTITWDSTNGNWTSNQPWNITTGNTFKINNVSVLSSTAVLGITPTINATGFTLSGGTTAVAVTFAGGAAYTLSGTNAQTYTLPTAGGTLLSTTTGVTTFSGGTTGLTPNTATSGAITLAGTLATANGGTGLTTFTAANNAIYSTSASALTAGTLPVLAGGTGTTTSTGTGSVVLGTSPTIATPTLTLSTTSSTTDGRISWDATNDKIQVGDGTNTLDFATSTLRIATPTFTTNAYTAALTDKDKWLELSNSSTAGTFYINTDANVNFPIGSQLNILQTGTGQITIAATTPATTTINGTPGLKLRAQWSSATIIKRAANSWVAVGDLIA